MATNQRNKVLVLLVIIIVIAGGFVAVSSTKKDTTTSKTTSSSSAAAKTIPELVDNIPANNNKQLTLTGDIVHAGEAYYLTSPDKTSKSKTSAVEIKAKSSSIDLNTYAPVASNNGETPIAKGPFTVTGTFKKPTNGSPVLIVDSVKKK